MRYLPEKAAFVLRLVVLAVLLCAQSLSFAHEMGHLDAGDTNLCAVCSISTGLDSPVHVEHEFPDSQPAIHTGCGNPAPVGPRVSASPLTARAPPHTS